VKLVNIRQLTRALLGLLFFTSCTTPIAPTASPQTDVDVLSYLLGDSALWPRVGSHSQNQIVDLTRHEVCWVKYANPRRFECWRWDDRFVYHAVDHALDGDSNESYRFTDGRWLPRFIPAAATAAAPWTLDIGRNEIVWFDAACQIDAARSHAFPYRQRVWVEPALDGGPALGVRSALILEYEPYDPAATSETRGAIERFSFGRGAGWYQWERGGFVDVFNRVGGPAVAMNRQAWCAGANP
jgi:hypothetical protein